MSSVCRVVGGGPSGTSTVGLVDVSTLALLSSPPPLATRTTTTAMIAPTAEDAEEDQLVALHSGMLPCLRFGCSTRLVCRVRSARISFGRVSCGSITSSM